MNQKFIGLNNQSSQCPESATCKVIPSEKSTRPMNYPFCCSPGGFNVPQFRLTRVQEIQLLERELCFYSLEEFQENFCREKFTFNRSCRNYHIMNPEFIFELERITKEKNSCPFHASFLYDLRKGFIKIALSLRTVRGSEKPFQGVVKFWISK